MPVFAYIGAAVAASATGIAVAAALGISAAVLGGIVAFGAAYVTSRIINGNQNKGNNSAANQGGRIQVAPATNNKIPVIYGNAYVNGMITDARLISLEQKKNDKMFYCLVLGETTNNVSTTYGLEGVYWNDLRLNPIDATANAHIVKDGRKVVDGAVFSAGAFVVGKTYVISNIGTTTQAQWNTIAGTAGRAYGIGSVFKAATTGASSGTGQAQEEDFIDENFIIGTEQYVELRVYAGGSTAADQIYPAQSTGNTANAYNFWGSGGTLYPDGDGSWTSANEMKGLVFAIVSVRYNGEKGFTGLPNVTFNIANNVTNPADVWYDYMTSKRYGAGIDPAYIDTTAQTDWYNFCEEDISYTSANLDPQGGAGTTNQLTSRYSINGVIDTSNQVKTNIDTILQNGGAWMSYNVDTGLWSPIIKKAVSAGTGTDAATLFTASRSGSTLTVTSFPSGRIETGQELYNSTGTLIGTITAQLLPLTAGETTGQIGRYTTSSSGTITSTTFYTLPASTLEFSDDNIISGITISSTRLEDLYNQVEVEFYNKYNKDQKAYFRNYLDAGDRNPNEPDNQLRMSLDLCNNSMQADILGQMELRQSRDDLVIEFTSTYYGIQAQSGDVIAVTSELYGWAPKYFRIMRVKEIEGDNGSLTANIQALEYNPDAYTVEPITEFSTAANINIGVYGASPNLPLPPSVVIAAVDADAPIPNFQLQVTVPASGGPFDEIELYYHEGWDQHPITGSIVPGTGSNGAAIGQGLLTVTATTYGNINPGDRIDLLAPAQDIFIVSQITNNPVSKTFSSGGVPGTSTSTLITLNNVTGLLVGNTLTGTGIANGSFIIEIDSGTNTVRIEDAVTVQAAGTYTVSGGLGTYIVDTSTTISGTADLYDFPEEDNYKLLKKLTPEGNNPTFTNSSIVTDVVTTVPANSATYRRWFVIARMGIKKRFGSFSEPGDVDFEEGRFLYEPNPSGSGGAGVFSSVDINNTTPFLTFSTQADGVNPMYGIRGKSTLDDAWFVGAGSTGNDEGYLELATGDNAGGSNDGGQIYVRQYNGASPGTGVPWYGGNGTVVNELTLLDNLGNTIIPNNLTVNSVLFVDGASNEVGINNTSPAYALDVTGEIRLSGENLYMNQDDTGADVSVHFNTGRTLKWSNGSQRFELNGDTYIQDNLTVAGSTTLGNDYIVDETQVVGEFKVTNNSVDNLFVDRNTGYVGINDNTPSYNLDVNGTANIETSLTVPSITTLTGDDLSITAFAGRDVTISTTTAADPVTIVRNTATTNAFTRALTLRTNSSGTPAVGFGSALDFEIETASNVTKAAGFIEVEATNVTTGDETFRMNFGLMNDNNTYDSVATLTSLGNLQIDGELTVSGNVIKSSTATALTLSGSNVTVEADLNVKGTTLTLNSDGTGTEDVTIKVERGATDATIAWSETNDRWEVSDDLYTPNATIGNIDIDRTNGQIDTNGGVNLTLDSDGGTVLINDNLNVNSGVLYVDAGSNEVGINTATPTKALDVVGEAKISSEVTIGNSSTFSNVNYQEVRFETYNFNAATGTPTQVGIDLFAKSTYRSARYSITMTKGSEYQMVNISIIHDGTTAYMSISDDIATGSNIATFDLTVDSTHVVLYATVNGTVNFKWYRWLTETN